MSNTVFYIIAVVALIAAVTLMKYVVSCLMRSVILLVTLVGLALVYYFFVGQYDPVTSGLILFRNLGRRN